MKSYKQHDDDNGTNNDSMKDKECYREDHGKPGLDFVFDNGCVHREVHVFLFQSSNMVIQCSKKAFLPQEIAIQHPESDSREECEVHEIHPAFASCQSKQCRYKNDSPSLEHEGITG